MKRHEIVGLVGVIEKLRNRAKQYKQNREVTISNFNIRGKAVMGSEVYWVIDSF